MGIYVIEKDGFENIEDGRYVVNGIADIITKKEDGTPYFKENNGDLKVMLKLRTITGIDGPAMSVTPAEFVALVHAFGATDFLPSYDDRMLATTLLRGMNEANEKSKKLSVDSVNGYANRANDSHAGEGMHTVKFIGTPGDLNTWIEGTYGQYMTFLFEIVGDAKGNPSVWTGYRIPIFMSDVFVDMQDDGTGKILNAMELETPIMLGGVNARRWEAFIKYFAPDVANRHWEVNPAKSEYGVCEVTDPATVIINEALKAKRSMKVYYKSFPKKQGGVSWKFELTSLPEWNDLETSSTNSVKVEDFVRFVADKTWPADDDKVFENIFESTKPVVFSADGIQWAQKYLGGEAGPWAEAGLPLENKPPLEALTSAQLTALMQTMRQRYP